MPRIPLSVRVIQSVVCIAITLAFAGDGPAGAAPTDGSRGEPPCGRAFFSLAHTPIMRTYAGTMADIDGDGSAEMVIRTNAGLGIYRDADGDGILELVQLAGSVAGPAPREVVAADCDGDGDLDIASVGETIANSPSVAYYRNDGGTLVGAANYLCGNAARQIAAADLDGDGRSDLVACSKIPATIYIFRGGANVPLAPITLDGVSLVWGVTVGDFDNDGDPDIVAACVPESESVTYLVMYRNEGSFQFTQLAPRVVAFRGAQLRAADLDGDGDDDISLISQDSAGDSYALCFSHVGLIGQPQVFSLGIPTNTHELVDIDLDGKADLVIAAGHPPVGTLCVRLNQGGGSFGPVQTSRVGLKTAAMVVGDVDGDGYPDAVVSERDTESGCVVARGGPAGVLGGNFALAISGASRIAAGDVDGDGDTDIVTIVTPGTIRVVKGDGVGGYAISQVITAPAGSSAEVGVALGDLDGDEDLDIVAAIGNYGEVRTFKNNGNGEFGAPTVVPSPSVREGVRLGDVNGDGHLDAVVTSAASLTWVTVHPNDGAGGLGPGQPQPAAPDLIRDIELGDIDGDGDLDLATQRLGLLEWRVNDSTGSFAVSHVISPYASQYGVELADIDRDGDLDVLAPVLIPSWQTPNRMGVFVNEGIGVFSIGRPFVIDSNTRSLLVADVDDDGVMDLLFGYADLPGIKFLRGIGDREFAPANDFLARCDNGVMALADADMDGRTDVVTLTQGVGLLMVTRSYLCPPSEVPGDLNGDGAVNGADLGILLSQWGAAAGATADLNGDGTVNGSDLGILLSGWST